VAPWLGGFAALVSRLAPERSPRFTQYLEDRLACLERLIAARIEELRQRVQ